MIEFTVPAAPVPQPRARATAVNGRARMYGAKKSHPIHVFKAAVQLAFAKAYTGPPIEGPIEIEIVFVLPRPKSMRWKTKPMPRVLHPKRPDIDNLTKGVLDALNGLAWGDDGQIYRAAVSKWYASGDEQPHTTIEFRRVAM